MINGNKKDLLTDNNDLIECMKQFGKEMATSIKMMKNTNDVENNVIFEKKKEKRKSILDFELPEIKKKNDAINVLILDKTEKTSIYNYQDLFGDDESSKNVKSTVNKSFLREKLKLRIKKRNILKCCEIKRIKRK